MPLDFTPRIRCLSSPLIWPVSDMWWSVFPVAIWRTGGGPSRGRHAEPDEHRHRRHLDGGVHLQRQVRQSGPARTAEPGAARGIDQHPYRRERLGHTPLPCGHPGSRRRRRYPHPQERAPLKRRLFGRDGSERDLARHPAPWASHLEAMDRLSCPKSGRGQPFRDLALQSTAGQWMRCTKPFGERIGSRDPDRQAAEIHIPIALMNRFYELGMAKIECVA